MSDSLKPLVRDLVKMCEDSFIDGGDIQELLIKNGCIELKTINEPCGEECLCSEVGCTFPTLCYRLTAEFEDE